MLDGEARGWVEETLAGLSRREKAAQLVSVWISGGYASATSEEMEALGRLVDEGIGAVTISIGLPHEYAAKLNSLQARAQVPLLVASDFESGGPGMRLSGIYALPSMLDMGGGTQLPATMAFGAIGEERFAYEAGRITGAEARAVGVHVAFAPVLDVNSNPENPIINTRAFGEDPEDVARLGIAFLRGAREAGLLTTAKHFPGHGDTREDSHIELPVVPADRARLDSLELVPFQRAIRAGVDAVMTAHVALPGVLGPGAPPATLSPALMTRLLREELGFEGLLYTDAMTMGAIVEAYEPGEAAVLAVEAGADVVLSPADPVAAIEGLAAAVREGRLAEERLDASVRRLLEAKARAGLHRGRRVDPEAVPAVVGLRSHAAFADTAARRALTAPRDLEGLVPLDRTVRRALSVTFAEPADRAAGRVFDRRLASAGLEVHSVRADRTTRPAVWDSLAAAAAVAYDAVVVSAYVSPRPWAGSVDVPDPMAGFLERMRDADRPTLLLSFGSPYLLSRAPDAGTYLIAWGGAPVSQRAAADALLGRTAVEGRLPISLPPFHRRGEGLRRPIASLPPVSPGREAPAEAVAMDAEALEKVDRILRLAIADSVTPGAALAVGRRGRLVRLRGYGRTDWAPGAPTVTDSTIYDVASLTKAVGTATAILLLAEEGRLSLHDPVARWLPEWRSGPLEPITVRDLLLHRSGLPPFLPLWQERRGPEDFRRALSDLAPLHAPGDSTVYSDLGFLALGFVVEAAAGLPLDEFLAARVFGPLGMTDTAFRPPSARRARIAPTEVDSAYRGRHVHGEVHDENAHAAGGVAGHAGLFSSARDLSAFAAMLLDGGEGDPRGGGSGPAIRQGEGGTARARILAPGSVDLLARRADDRSTRTLGWDTPSGRSSAGDYLGVRAFGHTGFTGTSLWIDPDLDLFVVLLTNRVNPDRRGTGIGALRRAVHDGIARAVADPTPTRRPDPSRPPR